jgi:hypothetical protein
MTWKRARLGGRHRRRLGAWLGDRIRAVRLLRKQGRVRARAEVRFQPEGGSVTRVSKRITLKR